MATYSPSQLEAFNECELRYAYQYDTKLRLTKEDASQALASGRALHEVVAYVLTHDKQPPNDALLARALYNAMESNPSQRLELSREPFEYNPKETQWAKVVRYMKGVERAYSKIPPYLLELDWHVEETLEVEFEGFTLKGRPDLWCELPTVYGPNAIYIVDIKTTENDPLEYVLWSPQLRVYAMMLQKMYPDRPILYTYLCCPTTVKQAPVVQHLFDETAQQRTMAYVVDMVSRIEARDASAPHPREGKHCKFCDYAQMCKVRVTGGDEWGVAKQLYYAKE